MENGSGKDVKVKTEPVDGDEKAEEATIMENGSGKDVEVKTEPVDGDEKAEEANAVPKPSDSETAVKAEKDTAAEVKTEVTDEPADVKSEEPTEELLQKIKSQVEFYFGDINLPRDKFLSEQTKLDEGWVPMTVMLNFKMLAAISKDLNVILKALEKSELIEISEDQKKIRRSPSKPLPVIDEAYKKAQAERTVYAKGFPLGGTTIEKLKEFFKDYEPFENIILRKYQNSEKKLMFKGSIFVQFTTLEGAKAFMARESVKYGDTELIRKFSEDYAVEKAKEKEERKLKKGEKKEIKTEETDKDTKAEDDFELPKGSALHFKIAEGAEYLTRERIKEHIADLGGDVAFVDFQMGDKEGWIRLHDENSGKAVLAKMDNNTWSKSFHHHEYTGDVTVTFRLLEGEEEETYLESVKEKIKTLRLKTKAPKRGRSRRGRGGGQRGRKRHGSPGHGAVPAKKFGAH